MRIFLSWSGKKSHNVALALKEWLPLVIQSVDTYVSSEDIDKGARWSLDIAKELETCSYGIICVTKDNLVSPWVNFEAGALSKYVNESYVSPFLFDIKKSEISGPLVQFQSTSYEREDVKKLLKSINKACGEQGLPDDRLDSIFNAMWQILKQKLDTILEETKDVANKTSTESVIEETKENLNERVLEEILELSRSQQKILNSPQDFIPLDFLKDQVSSLFNEVSMMTRTSKEMEIVRSLSVSINRNLKMLGKLYQNFPSVEGLDFTKEFNNKEIIYVLEQIRSDHANLIDDTHRLMNEIVYITSNMQRSLDIKLDSSVKRSSQQDIRRRLMPKERLRDVIIDKG